MRRPHVPATIALALLSAADPSRSAGWESRPGSGPEPRTGHTMVFDQARSVVVLFGGNVQGTGPAKDVWEYDGAAWTQGAAAPPAMSPRREHAMAHDSSRQVSIVFGGRDVTAAALDDTWEFDGTAWSPGPPPAPGLTPRYGMVMVFATARGRTVMYGGRDDSGGDVDETWEHDGTSWTAGPATPPGLDGRTGHGMAYHADSSLVVLFGGLDDAGVYHDDLWRYDGSAWTPGNPVPGALRRRVTTMAPGASPTTLLLFGGYGAGGFHMDSWELTADHAKQLPAQAYGPDARSSHAMAYDAGRDRVVLFGGTNGAVLLGDTWEYVPAPAGDYLVGAGAGVTNPNLVGVFDQSGTLVGSFSSYGAGAWGCNVAAGAIGGGTYEEVLTGPGPGEIFGPQVRAFDRSGAPLGKVNFYAYGTLRYGVRLTAGDTDGDRYDEILTSPGPGTVFGPHIRGFDYDGAAISAIAGINFYAYATLRFGADVATTDLDGDGYDEGLTAPGPSPQFGPQIRGWDFDGGPAQPIGKVNFMAFDPPQEHGAFVAGGDVDADRFGEILCARGAGASQTSQLRGFTYDGIAVALLPGFDVVAYPGSVGGARVGSGEVSGDSRDEILASPGGDPAATPLVRSYDYDGAALAAVLSFTAFPSLAYGANPAGATLGF